MRFKHLSASPLFRQVVLALLAGLVLFCREPESFIHPRMWAEDGPVFFRDAREAGLSVIFHPYNGYLHLMPRLFAAPTVWLPAIWVPWWFNYAAILLTMAVAVKIGGARWDFTLAPLMGIAVAAVPHFGEVFVTLTNVQWMVAPVLVVLAVQRDPESRVAWASDLVWLTLSGLSGPFICFLWPLYALRIARKPRSRYGFMLFGLATCFAIIQAMAMVTQSQGTRPTPAAWLVSWVLFSERVLDGVLSGQNLSHFLSHRVMVVLTPAIMLAAGVVFWKKRPEWTPHARFAVVAMLLSGFLLWAPVLWKFGQAAVILVGKTDGDRYFYQARLMLMWVLLAAWDLKSWARITAAALLLCCLGAAITTTVKRESIQDDHWELVAPDIDAGREVQLVVNPGMEMKLQARR